MADEPNGEKIHPPTESKIRRAREKGEVPKSRDLVTASVMLGVCGVLAFLGPKLCVSVAEGMSDTLSDPPVVRYSAEAIYSRMLAWQRLTIGALLPITAAIALVAWLANVSQTGWLLSTARLTPDINRINPLSGLQRLASLASVMQLVFSFLKITVVVLLAGFIFWRTLPTILNWRGLSPQNVSAEVGWLIVMLALWLSSLLFILALLDLLYQRYRYFEQLKMTTQELKDELKQQNGDPLVRERRKMAHRKLMEASEYRAAADANVNVTNPTHYTVALAYDPRKHAAPVVVAKGVDEKALRLRRIAVRNGVPIVERPELARSLYARVEVGQAIPEELYAAMIEIMAYVYRLTGQQLPGESAA